MKSKILLIGLLGGALFFNTASFKSVAAEVNIPVTDTAQTKAFLAQNTNQTKEVNKITKEKKVVKDSGQDETKNEKVSNTKASRSVSKSNSGSYASDDLKYLACLIYTESGNQGRSGKIAVGNVVLNRKKSNSYKNTIYGVINESGQFGVVRNGSFASAVKSYESGNFNSSSEKASIEAAKAALAGESVVGSRLSFTRYSSSLAKKHPSGVKIGNHYFY